MSEGQIVVEDPQNMLDKILDLPDQLEKAWTSIWTKSLPITGDSFDKVVIVGLGGSGISGSLFLDLYGRKLAKPVTVWADYGLPGWADNRTLLVAVSYSGDTEETLDSVKNAVERKSPIIAISSGGKLEDLAGINGFTLLKVDYKSPPRAALGYLYGSLLTVMTKLSLTDLT